MLKYHTIILIICSLFLFSCYKPHYVPYAPDITQVVNPKATIKNTIESQTSAQRYKPDSVEVTDNNIKLYSIISGEYGIGYYRGLAFIPKGDQIEVKTISFRHIGGVNLIWDEKNDQWFVEIYDKEGYLFCDVFTYSKNESERLIDAIFFLRSISQ